MHLVEGVRKAMKLSCSSCPLLPVAFVVSAITYVYSVTVFVFIDQWFGLMSSLGIMNAIFFTAVVVLGIFNYAVASSTDPGRVPDTFAPPNVQDADNTIQEIKPKSEDLRYCQKCSHYKPHRAHHCRVCKRCVLQMDHHCIWINNCVGHANYKFFFVLVLDGVIASFYSLILLVGSVKFGNQKEEQQSGGSSRLVYVISGVLLVLLCVALSLLLGCHSYLSLRNKTTIEYFHPKNE